MILSYWGEESTTVGLMERARQWPELQGNRSTAAGSPRWRDWWWLALQRKVRGRSRELWRRCYDERRAERRWTEARPVVGCVRKIGCGT
ncbi:hypothetical protein ZOSMA_118G00020 [Zostera marina]|uniref:Uncharacterized protein n=1 Tax=Zostera marina TaxID=29655 RepID=A0A0K9Q1H6_ZOSMR|nr:hypothetical protein ZOSMA_118G00020 [Zostera marina]